MNYRKIALVSADVFAFIILNKMRKRRWTLWSRKWLLRRNTGRDLAHLVHQELRYEDENGFQNFARMSIPTLDKLVGKVLTRYTWFLEFWKFLLTTQFCKVFKPSDVPEVLFLFSGKISLKINNLSWQSANVSVVLQISLKFCVFFRSSANFPKNLQSSWIPEDLRSLKINNYLWCSQNF